MLRSTEIEIADKILKYLLDQSKSIDPKGDDFKKYFGNLSSQCNAIGERLADEEYKLIRKTSGGYFELTTEGEKAAKDSIAKYLENKEYLKNLSIKADEASIKSLAISEKANTISEIALKKSKQNNRLLIFSIILTISFFLVENKSKFLVSKNRDNTKSKTENNRNNSKPSTKNTMMKGNSRQIFDSLAKRTIKIKSDSIKKPKK
jgi:hypothetical protein